MPGSKVELASRWRLSKAWFNDTKCKLPIPWNIIMSRPIVIFNMYSVICHDSRSGSHAFKYYLIYAVVCACSMDKLWICDLQNISSLHKEGIFQKLYDPCPSILL